MLGFDSFADLVLEDRMAQSAARAREFVQDLTRRTRPAFERENAELVAFRRELEGPDAPELQPWDLAYYADKLKQARYQLDEEELRAYFPAEQVLHGLFSTAERLYGIRFEPREGVGAWDDAVRAYRILDADGSELALFYADLFPGKTRPAAPGCTVSSPRCRPHRTWR